MTHQSRLRSRRLIGAVATAAVTLAMAASLDAPAGAASAAKTAAPAVKAAPVKTVRSLKTGRVAASKAAKAAASDVWTPTDTDLAARDDGHRRAVDPSDYEAYTLDQSRIATQLNRAPDEDASKGGTLISVPAPDGELVDFRVVQTQMMEPGLAAKHPEITTYAGKAVDSNASIVMDSGPLGFHASVRGSGATWYVDPGYIGEPDGVYLSYRFNTLPEPTQDFIERETADAESQAAAGKIAPRLGEAGGQVVTRRTYRLALVTDPSYAEFFAPGLNDGTQDAQSNSIVLAAKTTLMDRVNQAYTNDLAVRMVFIAGEDRLNLNNAAKATGANGPCGAAACYTTAQLTSCGSSTLTRNRYVVGLLVGAANFDIGHIGLGVNGGGIASLGVVGGANKAQGCTGIPTPVGDFYAIDYVAHEMGHEFSGNHPFNGTKLNCSTGNRNAGTSVEPGSGDSIMAYAGICASDDLQPHSDPYFSQRSQQEITTYLTRTLANVNEVQMAALNGFSTDGNAFTLTYPSFTNAAGATVPAGTTPPIVRGQTGTACTTTAPITCPYSAAGIKAAIESVTGPTATVVGFYGTGTPGDTGFTVTYSSATGTTQLGGVDVGNPTLNITSGTFTGTISDIAKGGPATNNGIQDQPDGNHAPTVTVPASKTIPIQTPFTLTGSGTDVDNDSLYYLWEQNDVGAAGTAGGTALTNNTKANGPLFRIFGNYGDITAAATVQYQSPGENLVTTNPSRTFPDISQILAGSTNQLNGTCPTPAAADTKTGVADTALKPGAILDCYSEFLPTASYVGTAAAANTEPSLNFRLTARDQDPVDGGYQFAQTKLLLDRTAGPLYVTSIAAPGTTVPGGSTQTVTWNVNSTDKATLAPNVKISLSTDGGFTYPTVLDASTANDGSDDVVIPNVGASKARIKVEAVDNYFFDVNHADFAISSAPNAVTNVVAQAGDSRVHLTFTPPASGPTPTGYTVTQTLGDQVGMTYVVPAGATTADITGLTNGTNYAFTVTAVNSGTSGTASPVSNNVTPRVVAGEFTSLSPVRILDTRSPTGVTSGSPVGAGTANEVSVPVLGRGGIPSTGVNAVVLNLTGVNASQSTYVAAMGSRGPAYTSNLNFSDVNAKAVQVTVPVASDGTITVFNSSGTIDLIADVEGYYQDDTALEAGRVHTVSAKRVLDTRNGLGMSGGNPGTLGEGQTIDVQVAGTGASNTNVPASATAVIMNLTGIAPSQNTYLRAYSATGPQPETSSVNIASGSVVANLVTVPLSSTGRMRLFNASGNVNIVADVVGYVTPPNDSSGRRFLAVSPARVLDTRSGSPVGEGQTVETGVNAPAGATGVLVNVTSVRPSKATYLSVLPPGTPAYTSTLNTGAGDIVSNAAMTPLGTDSQVTNGIGVFNAQGSDDVLVDVQGYLIP